jgi:multiple sugar transport system substrate-binding protein
MAMRRRDFLGGLAASGATACQRTGRARPGRIVFKHQPLWGSARPFEALLDDFRAAHPKHELVTESLPNDSDVAHQFFVTALEGGASDVDVLVLDIVWVAEFARAGWIADLSSDISPSAIRREFLPGAAEAVLFAGRTWAIPWYSDVGVLYRRTDWVPRAPATYADLIETALSRRSDAVAGYVWQGRQYEGLVCNAYEFIWGHGGATLEGDRLVLDGARARNAIALLRALVTRGVSPISVSTMAEEDARRVFQAGRAVFMRNWPYALHESEHMSSPIRGRVGVSPLPTLSGEPGHGTLGGYQLAVNAHALPENRAIAVALIQHLTSAASQLVLAEAYGRNPSRRDVYEDPRLASRAPLAALMRPMLERARPRPVTPFYPMLTDILQGELSAAISGVREPAAALRRAQALSDHVIGRPR